MATNRYHFYEAEVRAEEEAVVDFVRDYALEPDYGKAELPLSVVQLGVRDARHDPESQSWPLGEIGLHLPVRVRRFDLAVTASPSRNVPSHIDLSVDRDSPLRRVRKSLVLAGGALSLSGTAEIDDYLQASRKKFLALLDSQKRDLTTTLRLERKEGSYYGFIALARIPVKNDSYRI